MENANSVEIKLVGAVNELARKENHQTDPCELLASG